MPRSSLLALGLLSVAAAATTTVSGTAALAGTSHSSLSIRFALRVTLRSIIVKGRVYLGQQQPTGGAITIEDSVISYLDDYRTTPLQVTLRRVTVGAVAGVSVTTGLSFDRGFYADGTQADGVAPGLLMDNCTVHAMKTGLKVGPLVNAAVTVRDSVIYTVTTTATSGSTIGLDFYAVHPGSRVLVAGGSVSAITDSTNAGSSAVGIAASLNGATLKIEGTKVRATAAVGAGVGVEIHSGSGNDRMSGCAALTDVTVTAGCLEGVMCSPSPRSAALALGKNGVLRNSIIAVSRCSFSAGGASVRTLLLAEVEHTTVHLGGVTAEVAVGSQDAGSAALAVMGSDGLVLVAQDLTLTGRHSHCAEFPSRSFETASAPVVWLADTIMSGCPTGAPAPTTATVSAQCLVAGDGTPPAAAYGGGTLVLCPPGGKAPPPPALPAPSTSGWLQHMPVCLSSIGRTAESLRVAAPAQQTVDSSVSGAADDAALLVFQLPAGASSIVSLTGGTFDWTFVQADDAAATVTLDGALIAKALRFTVPLAGNWDFVSVTVGSDSTSNAEAVSLDAGSADGASLRFSGCRIYAAQRGVVAAVTVRGLITFEDTIVTVKSSTSGDVAAIEMLFIAYAKLRISRSLVMAYSNYAGTHPKALHLGAARSSIQIDSSAVSAGQQTMNTNRGGATAIHIPKLSESCMAVTNTTAEASVDTRAAAAASRYSYYAIRFGVVKTSVLVLRDPTAVAVGSSGDALHLDELIRSAVAVVGANLTAVLHGQSASPSTASRMNAAQLRSTTKSNMHVVGGVLMSPQGTGFKFPIKSQSAAAVGSLFLDNVDWADTYRGFSAASTASTTMRLRVQCPMAGGTPQANAKGVLVPTTAPIPIVVEPCPGDGGLATPATSYAPDDSAPALNRCPAATVLDPLVKPRVIVGGDTLHCGTAELDAVGSLTVQGPAGASVAGCALRRMVVRREEAAPGAGLILNVSHSATSEGVVLVDSLPGGSIVVFDGCTLGTVGATAAAVSISGDIDVGASLVFRGGELRATEFGLDATSITVAGAVRFEGTRVVITHTADASRSAAGVSLKWLSGRLSFVPGAATPVPGGRRVAAVVAPAAAPSIFVNSKSSAPVRGIAVDALRLGELLADRLKMDLRSSAEAVGLLALSVTTGCVTALDTDTRTLCQGKCTSRRMHRGFDIRTSGVGSSIRLLRPRVSASGYDCRGVQLYLVGAQAYVDSAAVSCGSSAASRYETGVLIGKSLRTLFSLTKSNITAAKFALRISSVGFYSALHVEGNRFTKGEIVAATPTSQVRLNAPGNEHRTSVGGLFRPADKLFSSVASHTAVGVAWPEPLTPSQHPACRTSQQPALAAALGFDVSRFAFASSGGGGSDSSGDGTVKRRKASFYWIIGPGSGAVIVTAIAIFFVARKLRAAGDAEGGNDEAEPRADLAAAAPIAQRRPAPVDDIAGLERGADPDLAAFNLQPNQPVAEARLFEEATQDDVALNQMVRAEMGAGAAQAAAPALGAAGPQRTGLFATAASATPGDAPGGLHPLLLAQQSLADISRGDVPGPAALPPAYAPYCTGGFSHCRWRSADGRAAGFQGYDVFAGTLYPYAVMVTLYPGDSKAADRLGPVLKAGDEEAAARWAIALQGGGGANVLGVSVLPAPVGSEGWAQHAAAGLAVEQGGAAPPLLVTAVTALEPERLSASRLLDSGALNPQHRHAVAAAVAGGYAAARAAGVHCPPLLTAAFVDPHTGAVALKDRRVGDLPPEPAAAHELCDFAAAAWTAVPGGTTVAAVAAAVGAPQPAPLFGFLDDGAVPMQLELECCVCGLEVRNAETGVRGAECCAPARHFVCAECINSRFSAALDDSQTDFTSIPCAMAPGCPSVWAFDDFGALLNPVALRRWQRQSVAAAQAAAHKAAAENLAALQQQLAAGGEVSAAQAELRRHTAAVRTALRPACPLCRAPFESFTGCVAVTCGARDGRGQQVAGCGRNFCGACMAPSPCPARHGHAFMSTGQLHTAWRVWRRERVVQYLARHFRGGPEDAHAAAGRPEDGERMLRLVLRAARSDLGTAGVHPLPAPWIESAV